MSSNVFSRFGSFPQGLVNYLSPKSRQAIRLKSANHQMLMSDECQSATLRQNRVLMSPSATRKQSSSYRAQLRKYNLCFLEAGQMIGQTELTPNL